MHRNSKRAFAVIKDKLMTQILVNKFADLVISNTCQIPTLRYYFEKYLPRQGTFVEIGANDGETVSNTSGLADIGWIGFYVEPIPKVAKTCMIRHQKNNVKVFCGAISDRDGEITIYDTGLLSTASTETRDAHSEIDWARHVEVKEELKVPAITLNRFLIENSISFDFDLLVVDVEGFEEKVFNGFDMTRFKPRMIIVELNDYHPSFDSYPTLQYSSNRVRNRIVWSGYQQVYGDEINSIFVR